MFSHGLCLEDKSREDKEGWSNERESAPQSFACRKIVRTISFETKEVAYFKLCHKRFNGVEEFSGGRMRNPLQVKPLPESRK
jgi:hypothetical protein